MQVTAAIYLRLSDDDGRGGESQSIETQRRRCREYCERQGWTPVEVAEPDDGYSGSDPNLKRPGFIAVLEAMAGGKVQAVVALKQDRIARNDPHWNEFRSTAEIAGVVVHTVEAGDLNLGTDIGYLNTGMRQVFSNFEARLIASRTRDGFETARSKGKWTYSATFGYEKGGIIDPVEAKWIRWAFDGILAGELTPMDVFTRFNDEDVLTARGNRWTSVSRVITMLKNPALAGFVTHKGEIVGMGVWEPIVTPEEREKLIAVLNARSTGRKGHAKRPARRYPLAGLALCGNPECSLFLKPMVAHIAGRGRSHAYYCDPRRGGCKVRVNGPTLDSLAEGTCLAFLTNEQEPTVTVAAWDSSEQDEITAEIAEVRAMAANGAMRAADAAPILNGLNERLDKLNAAEREHTAKSEVARHWRRTSARDIAMSDDVFRFRGVLDNVRCLPDKAGFIFESKRGETRRVVAVGA